MVSVKWVGSPNYRRLPFNRKKFLVLHWMVGTLESTDRIFANPKSKVSTQYGIEDKTVHKYVKSRDYAFGSGTTYANTFGISIEHSGGDRLPDGTRRKPSAITHETSAQLCAEIARRRRWGKLIIGKNVFPHSHFKATECPGTLDIHWIVNRANAINRY